MKTLEKYPPHPLKRTRTQSLFLPPLTLSPSGKTSPATASSSNGFLPPSHRRRRAPRGPGLRVPVAEAFLRLRGTPARLRLPRGRRRGGAPAGPARAAAAAEASGRGGGRAEGDDTAPRVRLQPLADRHGVPQGPRAHPRADDRHLPQHPRHRPRKVTPPAH